MGASDTPTPQRSKQMSDNCFKLYLIDGNLQLISHEEAEEIERRNRMVPDLALLLVEIQNMRKRWADEDAALTREGFHLVTCHE